MQFLSNSLFFSFWLWLCVSAVAILDPKDQILMSTGPTRAKQTSQLTKQKLVLEIKSQSNRIRVLGIGHRLLVELLKESRNQAL
uniref:Secreted protein n=1 Tax=Globodera pallida TaxID=36090 RepID=A0A183C5P2_GLOPA